MTEAVDREDRRFVKGLQRQIKPQQHVVIGQSVPGSQRLQQRVDEGVCQRRPAATQLRQRLAYARANAFAQFSRCCVGESHNQDLLHIQPAFKQQAQVQTADVPCFAGTG